MKSSRISTSTIGAAPFTSQWSCCIRLIGLAQILNTMVGSLHILIAILNPRIFPRVLWVTVWCKYVSHLVYIMVILPNHMVKGSSPQEIKYKSCYQYWCFFVPLVPSSVGMRWPFSPTPTPQYISTLTLPTPPFSCFRCRRCSWSILHVFY